MTIHVWIDYAYYDGVLGFSQLAVRLDPDSPIRSAWVRWMDSEAIVDSEGKS